MNGRNGDHGPNVPGLVGLAIIEGREFVVEKMKIAKDTRLNSDRVELQDAVQVGW